MPTPIAPAAAQRTGVYRPLKALGAGFRTKTDDVRFQVMSEAGTRLQLELFNKNLGAGPVKALTPDDGLKKGQDGVWELDVSASELRKLGVPAKDVGLTEPEFEGCTVVYYGYRAWGGAFDYDPNWKPGSLAGFKDDVDSDGNRFNPNKLLHDPYAMELSHDGVGRHNPSDAVFASGPDNRDKDSGPFAAKGILVIPPKGKQLKMTEQEKFLRLRAPLRPLKDEVFVEAHMRGYTMRHPKVDPEKRGTYAGMAQMIPHFKQMGITTVKFLPVQEFDNQQNQTLADNDCAQNGSLRADFWGYNTVSFLALDKRYAHDKRPGGADREFASMVSTMVKAGIEPCMDMVFNHTLEGGTSPDGLSTQLRSMRGLDNAAYYEVTEDGRHIYDNTGTGGNYNVANRTARDLLLNTMRRFWNLGVRTFRFDLAAELANSVPRGGFNFDKFDPDNFLNEVHNRFPGIRLIAEPYTATGQQEQGEFPTGWSEQNTFYRDTVRKLENAFDRGGVTPGQFAQVVTGSPQLYQDDGRKPDASVNFVTFHDGMVLQDLVSSNTKNNNQPFPFGGSDGGGDDISSDHGGDPRRQQQAARNLLLTTAISAGVPLYLGGDEVGHSQRGNNNAYNLDTVATHVAWEKPDNSRKSFLARANAFRHAHPALRPAEYLRGEDTNGDGVKQLAFYRADAQTVDGAYMDNSFNAYLGWRLDGTELEGETAKSIYIARNASEVELDVNLPPPRAGNAWYRAADTADWFAEQGNWDTPGQEARIDATYHMHERTTAIFVELPINRTPGDTDSHNPPTVEWK